MALPPKGDSQRPLELAVRSSRLLGLILVVVAMLVFGMLMTGRVGQRGGFFTPVVVLTPLVWLVPGILYIAFSEQLSRRRMWAVIALMVLASLNATGALVQLVVSLFSQNLVAIGLSALLVAAMAQLIYHLSQSFTAVRRAARQSYGLLPIIAPPGHPPALPPSPAGPAGPGTRTVPP